MATPVAMTASAATARIEVMTSLFMRPPWVVARGSGGSVANLRGALRTFLRSAYTRRPAARPPFGGPGQRAAAEPERGEEHVEDEVGEHEQHPPRRPAPQRDPRAPVGVLC